MVFAHCVSTKLIDYADKYVSKGDTICGPHIPSCPLFKMSDFKTKNKETLCSHTAVDHTTSSNRHQLANTWERTAQKENI